MKKSRENSGQKLQRGLQFTYSNSTRDALNVKTVVLWIRVKNLIPNILEVF